MQLRLLYGVFFMALLFYGCTGEKSHTLQKVKSDSTEVQTFFPVTEYIKGQLSEIDSMPLTPLKIIIYNGKSDSIWMKKENIRAFAEPFLHPEIDTSNFKSLFIQKSFLDQTINAFTFSYDPIDKLPDSVSLKKWNVYIDPKKNTVKRIYIVKERISSNTMQTIQLTWKSNKWCKITTITEKNGESPDIKEEIMKWDFDE